MTLASPPSPLSRREWTTFWIVAAVAASSRFLAKAASIWGWDEALFCLGMRSYDVATHHPHPPGFPLYIGLAKLARLVTSSDFHALQAVNLTAGMMLLPAVFFFAREARLPFHTSLASGALCAFFPNVWFFGGTALSDIPSIVAATFAAALLLRGCRSGESYVAGALLLAIATGIRPQNLLVGIAPGLIATWYRARDSWRDVVFAAVLAGTVLAAAFGLAAAATGDIERYAAAVRDHSDYIARVDSFWNPERPALWRLVDRFFFRQYQSPVLSVVMSLFVLIGALASMRRRSMPMLLVVLTYAPVALMTWLMLDRFSINRFSIGYAPLFAILGAAGVRAVAERTGGRKVEALLAVALTGGFAIWTLPALSDVRRDESPPVRAVREARERVPAEKSELYAGFSLGPFVEYFASDVPYVRIAEERGMPLSTGERPRYLLAESLRTAEAGDMVFRRDRGRLWYITRHYYYDVVLRRLNDAPQFRAGWSEPQREGHREWRWMSSRSEAILPPVGGTAKLGLVFACTGEAVRAGATVSLFLDGRLLETMPAAVERTEREYDVNSAGEPALVISISPAIEGKPLRLDSLIWGPSAPRRQGP